MLFVGCEGVGQHFGNSVLQRFVFGTFEPEKFKYVHIKNTAE